MDMLAETIARRSVADRVVARRTTILVATDGTPQSDAAISLAHLMSVNDHCDVKALTVVGRVPIPWGTIDPSLVSDYEHGVHVEALRKAQEQVDRIGNKRWVVDVQVGDPASTIAASAKEAQAGLVIVGLGGHGPTARLFGNETALRLIRVSQTPVLAVDSSLRALPKHVMVAMDFSESAIDAARLAIELASPDATLTLVHVVPWERKDYLPEHWFREHEENVGSQLKRVAGWLGRPAGPRLHQRILYGKPGPALLACAEEIGADLVAAGRHGRGFIGRVLAGETVGKLVRGAKRSVLVVPASGSRPELDPSKAWASVNGAKGV